MLPCGGRNSFCHDALPCLRISILYSNRRNLLSSGQQKHNHTLTKTPKTKGIKVLHLFVIIKIILNVIRKPAVYDDKVQAIGVLRCMERCGDHARSPAQSARRRLAVVNHWNILDPILRSA